MAGKELSRQQRRAMEREQGLLGPAGRSGGVSAVGWSFRSGPLPDPKELAEFDQVVPGSAKTIVDKFAQQSERPTDLARFLLQKNERSYIEELPEGERWARWNIMGAFLVQRGCSFQQDKQDNQYAASRL